MQSDASSIVKYPTKMSVQLKRMKRYNKLLTIKIIKYIDHIPY